MMGAVGYINDHKETFAISFNVDYSLFTRATRNKSIQVEEKEYQLRFFFTAEKHRTELTKNWLTRIISDNTINGKCVLTDNELADEFLKTSVLVWLEGR